MAPGLGLNSERFPALALQNPIFGQVFPFEEKREISGEAVGEWVLDIVAGRVAPWASQNSVGTGKSGGQESGMRDEL